MKVIFAAINSKYIHTALGLRYVKEYCRERGLNADLIEEIDNYKTLKSAYINGFG